MSAELHGGDQKPNLTVTKESNKMNALKPCCTVLGLIVTSFTPFTAPPQAASSLNPSRAPETQRGASPSPSSWTSGLHGPQPTPKPLAVPSRTQQKLLIMPSM